MDERFVRPWTNALFGPAWHVDARFAHLATKRSIGAPRGAPFHLKGIMTREEMMLRFGDVRCSAPASNVGTTARPIALAVLLMISSRLYDVQLLSQGR